MTSKGTGPKRLDEPTLTIADWIEGALQLIAESGLGALTIAALATRLGVTKGSFYWHFKTRSELIEKTLDRWEKRATVEAMIGLSAVPDAGQRLHFMLEAATQQPRARSLYAALAQASGDETVRRVLNRVAKARVKYLELTYIDLGLTPDEAKAKAVFAYATYRGPPPARKRSASHPPPELGSLLSTYPPGPRPGQPVFKEKVTPTLKSIPLL